MRIHRDGEFESRHRRFVSRNRVRGLRDAGVDVPYDLEALGHARQVIAGSVPRIMNVKE